MRNLTVPYWVKELDISYQYDHIPIQLYRKINDNLKQNTSKTPEVTILIPVLNEEESILKTLNSLSVQFTEYTYEIIVVDNGSTDHSQDILNNINIQSPIVKQKGQGIARQHGLKLAKGTYILLADGDTIYPNTWVQSMTSKLKQPNVVGVYGTYSFIPQNINRKRYALFIYESFKDVITELKNFKRPHLNSYGMNMGIVKKPALRFGFDLSNQRLDDGRMILNLSTLGKIVYIRSKKVRCWTIQRTIKQDGTIWQALFKRIKYELKKIPSYFSIQKHH